MHLYKGTSRPGTVLQITDRKVEVKHTCPAVCQVLGQDSRLQAEGRGRHTRPQVCQTWGRIAHYKAEGLPVQRYADTTMKP